MKTIRIFILSIFILVVIAGLAKNTLFDSPEVLRKIVKADAGLAQNRSMRASYKLFYWSLVPLGTLKFTAMPNSTGGFFSVEVSPKSGILGKSIEASARLESYFGNNGLPERYFEITNYKNKIKTKTIEFDRENLVAIRNGKKIKIPKDALDPLGAFARLLQSSLDTSEQTVKCISEDVIYDMRGSLLSEENGIWHVSIDIRREDGLPGHSTGFHVWLIKSTRLPILFKSWTPAGYATASLESIE